MNIIKKIKYLKECKSTNDYIKANSNLIDNGFLVYTFNQTKGRGQRGNKWYGLKYKNIYFSIYLKPQININEIFTINKITSLTIVKTLYEHIKTKKNNLIKIKWPNDILLKNKKVAGILIENVIKNNIVNESIIGIGINVNEKKFPENIPNAISLNIAFNKEFDKELILKTFIKNFESYYNKKTELLNKEYFKNLNGVDNYQKYKESGSNKIFNAKIIDILDNGKIKLKTELSKIIEFNFKEIEFIYNN